MLYPGSVVPLAMFKIIFNHGMICLCLNNLRSGSWLDAEYWNWSFEGREQWTWTGWKILLWRWRLQDFDNFTGQANYGFENCSDCCLDILQDLCCKCMRKLGRWLCQGLTFWKLAPCIKVCILCDEIMYGITLRVFQLDGLALMLQDSIALNTCISNYSVEQDRGEHQLDDYSLAQQRANCVALLL